MPPGFESGPENILIAFGDRTSGPNPLDRVAASSFETALFGRGRQAQDADDELLRLKKPLTAKTAAGAAAQAAAFGWAWLISGNASTSCGLEPLSNAWRATAKLELSTYEVGVSTTPMRWEVSGQSVDVSSVAAVARALEIASQEAAMRFDGEINRRRGGRATLAVLVSGRKELGYLLRVVKGLRRSRGIVAAALVMWNELKDMALLQAYAEGTKVDELAARLLQRDSSLRIDAVETEDGRLTLQGPQTSLSDDRGE